MDRSKIPGGIFGSIAVDFFEQQATPAIIAIADRCVTIVTKHGPPAHLTACLIEQGFTADAELIAKLHRAYMKACFLQTELPPTPPAIAAASNGARSE